MRIGRKRSRHARTDSFERRQTLISLRHDCKVDEHDAVFLNDSDQQDQADQPDQTEVKVEDKESRQGTDTG